jgi:hypothetical protein
MWTVAQPGPQQPAEHEIVGADDGGPVRDGDPLVLQGAHQEHRVLVVVGEDGVQAQRTPARREPGGGLLLVRQGQLGDRRVRTLQGPPHAVEAGPGEDLQAALLGHHHADPAAAPGQQMDTRAVADPAVVHEQRVGALDLFGAERDHGAGAGPLEDRDALRAEPAAGHEDRDRPQLGPGAGGLVAAQSDAAVLHDGVVEAAERRLELGEEPVVQGTHGHARGGHQDHAAVSGAQTAGGRVRDVPEFLGGLADPEPGGFTDPDGAGVVQDVRDGRARDSREACHIGTGRHGSLCGRRVGGLLRYLHHDIPHPSRGPNGAVCRGRPAGRPEHGTAASAKEVEGPVPVGRPRGYRSVDNLLRR